MGGTCASTLENPREGDGSSIFQEFLAKSYGDKQLKKAKSEKAEVSRRRESGCFYSLPQPKEIVESMRKREEDAGKSALSPKNWDPTFVNQQFAELLPSWRNKM